MARRLEVARRELLEAHRYRHRVVNEDPDEALAAIKRILFESGLPVQPTPPSRSAPSKTQEAHT
jgi:guanylate kinase